MLAEYCGPKVQVDALTLCGRIVAGLQGGPLWLSDEGFTCRAGHTLLTGYTLFNNCTLLYCSTWLHGCTLFTGCSVCTVCTGFSV
jgi:hypothetical protein